MPRRPISPVIKNKVRAGKKAQLRFNPGTQQDERSGAAQGASIDIVPEYFISDSEKITSSKVNAFIIMGKDRPSTKDTGWGAVPNKKNVARIDLIAGLSGPTAKETDAEGDRLKTNPSPGLDAARIYMTQQAKDIDSKEYFGIVDGSVGKVINESAIAIKADSVRLIGRRGIKIVTGSNRYSGGVGWFIGDDVPGIDIIAGNDDKDLQPMVKGNDLHKLLMKQMELHQELYDFIWFIFKLQVRHLGITMPNPYMAASIPSVIRLLGTEGIKQLIKMAVHQVKVIFHKVNFDERNPIRAYDFRSRHNHVN